MKLHKDILVIDFETTDITLDNAEPIQLGAILLDKETLEEKDAFNSYIAADLSKASPEAMRINGITAEQLTDAPTQEEVAQKFVDQFGFEPMLASWVNFLDRRMLEKLLATINLPINSYDYHYLDIWPVAYVHLMKSGYSGPIKSESMFEAFNLEKRGSHDALEDCRKAAEVLRKLLSA